MNTQIQIFKNSQFGEVRVTEIDGKTYFVGIDVAKVLGYTDPNQAIRQHVDEEDKTIVQLSDIQDTVKTTPHMQGSKIGLINESGVYSLILRSNMPRAKEFKRWITSEVIPAIRRTGGYIAAHADETPEEIMARALVVAQDTINRQKQRAELAEKKADLMESVADELHRENESMKPKVLFADAVATSDRSVLVSELAKILKQNGVDVGQNRLFEWLRKHGYLCSRGEYYNQPTQKAMELELFEIKKTSITKPDGSVLVTCTTKVTGKGQIYFVNKFIPKQAA
jgi:phage antirepressor YoqD-like protein